MRDRRVAREYAAFSREGFVYDEWQPAGEPRLEAGIPYVYQSAYDLTYRFLDQLLKE